MPIKIPATLPAFDVLSREGVSVMDEDAAARQDIRPLRIALLNLMPQEDSDRKPVCTSYRCDAPSD